MLIGGVDKLQRLCAGAGEVDIVAKVEVDGSSIVSNSYEVIDTVLYDKGLDGTGNYNDSAWETHTNLPFTRGTDGTTVTNSTSNNQYLIANITSGTQYDFTPPFRVEFNFEKLNTGSSNTQIQLYDVSNNNFTSWITTTGKYVIDVKANEVTWTINGQAQTGKTVSIGNAFVRFLMTGGASMKFSEFKIYPI